MKKKLLIICIGILIIINVISASWFPLHNDLFFHTDIARDFLLLEDMATNKLITLIGPRSGGIPGVFHGPLWLYLNLPAYLLGKGSPVVVAWFWVLLFIITLIIIYKCAIRIFDKWVAWLSILLFSSISAQAIPDLYNPYGAVILFPLFFLILIDYIKNGKIKSLTVSLFILGLIIQFQMAFGLPILVLIFLYLVSLLYQKKRLHHLIAFLIMLIPLSTYILFDLRHNFLQTKAVVDYFSVSKNLRQMKIGEYLFTRIKGALVSGFGIMPEKYWWLPIVTITSAFLYVFYINNVKNSKNKYSQIYSLFFYFYFGFWVLTFFFKGVVWGYYYWPFLSLTVIIFSSFYKLLNKKLFYFLFIIAFLVNFYDRIIFISSYGATHDQDGGLWKFNYQMADKIFADGGSEFSYYIYTPDQFGYSPRYAMNYLQKKYKNKKAIPFVKKAITYLIIAPAPKDRPFLNGDWWIINQVKISKKPNKVTKFTNGFRIEKYVLTSDEIKIKSDPNLIQSLHFR